MTQPIEQLTIATFNPGKLAEYRQLLGTAVVSLSALDDFSNIVEVDESAMSFAGNAALKAIGYAVQTGTVTLADDSGLEIDALEGRPGVLSARYAGEATSFAEKMAYVLDEIRNTGSPDRRARFVCEIVLADRNGSILAAARGVCEGNIAILPRGTGGFGYDPIFVPEGYLDTFGELPGSIKHEISHRARAFAQIIPFLRDKSAV
jgi:XTP/dITP diphosphohydrolase